VSPFAPPLDEPAAEAALALLAHGEIHVEGRLVDASNATLYCTVTLDGQPLRGRALAQTSLQSGLNVHSYATPPNRGAGGALVSVSCQR